MISGTEPLHDTPPKRAQPFLKWAGGKRQLLPELTRYVPSHFGAYHEPFVGGGALFFHLSPKRATLGDQNQRLIRAYRGVRNEVENVLTLLQSYPHTRDFFYDFRKTAIDTRSDAEVAAWFLYLNKTSFNGLYRVNRNNQYNVPFGDYKNLALCNPQALRVCAMALQPAELYEGGFETVLLHAKPGDFVYFDPPYVPLSITSRFTSYTAEGFGMDAQRRLRDTAWELKQRGVYVLLSNSSSPTVIELYQNGFELIPVQAARAISCKGTARGKVTELVIR